MVPVSVHWEGADAPISSNVPHGMGQAVYPPRFYPPARIPGRPSARGRGSEAASEVPRPSLARSRSQFELLPWDLDPFAATDPYQGQTMGIMLSDGHSRWRGNTRPGVAGTQGS